METNTATLWELWVDPVRRIVSFHPEAGSIWPFRAGSCSSAASTSTPRGSTGINRYKKRPWLSPGPLLVRARL